MLHLTELVLQGGQVCLQLSSILLLLVIQGCNALVEGLEIVHNCIALQL